MPALPELTTFSPLGSAHGLATMCTVGAVLLCLVYYVKLRLVSNTKDFVIANRKIGFGMGVAGLISIWTWSMAMLMSSGLTYEYGLSGLFWFTVPNGLAVIMIIPFAKKIRQIMPEGYTIAQFISVRYDYSKAAAWVVTIGMLFGSIIEITLNIKGASLVANAMFGLDSNVAAIAKGKSVQEGGARYGMSAPQGVGVANVGDSLMAVKKLVFEDGKLTLKQLKTILESNYGMGIDEGTLSSFTSKKGAAAKSVKVESAITPKEGEYYRQMIINAAPKYGNDLDEVDILAREGALIYCREVERYTCPRGGTFHPGLYPVSANVPMGKVCGATPDGRRAGEPLAEGVSPVSGRDRNGPTAALNSVSKLDHVKTSNGTLLNQKFHPSALAGQEGMENLTALVRSYFDNKGLHVQFNVVGKETLLDAQKNPDQHKNLVVRVAGYSAHFVHLNPDIQDDIISRTEQGF
ncbi:MAG: hypothetical protein LBD42_05475 [Desulfovibrio sp.]|jgi:pyruvate-formate lyase|nr:hypothetical protein [Desulfovibrio sp.]